MQRAESVLPLRSIDKEDIAIFVLQVVGSRRVEPQVEILSALRTLEDVIDQAVVFILGVARRTLLTAGALVRSEQ